MRLIEEDAFAFAPDLMLDKEIFLDLDKQIKIAKLACLMTCVGDLDLPATSGITADERKHLMTTEEPPDNCDIFIGRGPYTPDWSTRMTHHGGGQVISAGSPLPEGVEHHQITTFAMGHLLLHSVSGPKNYFVPDPDRYAASFGVFPIWPFKGAIGWRNLPKLTSFQATQLAYGLKWALEGKLPAQRQH
jgi:hypothetical protein